MLTAGGSQQGGGAKINVLLHAPLVQEGHSTNNLACLGGDNIVGSDDPRLCTWIISPDAYVLAIWKEVQE